MSESVQNRIRGLWGRMTDEEARELLAELAGRTRTGAPAERDGLFRRPDSDVWWASFVEDGKRVRISTKCTSKDAARDFLAARRRDAQSADLGIPKVCKLTFGELADLFMASPKAVQKASRSRDVWCIKQLKARFGDLPAPKVDRLAVECYQRDRLAEKVAPATINKAVALARRVLEYAVESGRLSVNPLRKAPFLDDRNSARSPILEPHEESALLAACSPPWLRFLVRILLLSGCRAGEVLALTFDDVDFNRGLFVIRSSKAGKPREVPIHPALVPDLKARQRAAEEAKASNEDELEARRDTTPARVIVKDDGEPPTIWGVDLAFRRAVRRVIGSDVPEDKRIRQKDLRIHDLRHIFCQRAIASGLTTFEVARILGHVDGTMIGRRYGDTTPARISERMASIAAAEPGTEAPIRRREPRGKVVALPVQTREVGK